jgi:hypothetical protein
MKRTALALATVATAAVGLWLLSVTFTILPSRDPANVVMWRWTAVGFLAYAALTAALLATSKPGRLLRSVVLLASLPVLACGAFALYAMVRRASTGGHFEGYVLLMGLVLLAHGASAIAYTLLPPAPRAHLPAV